MDTDYTKPLSAAIDLIGGPSEAAARLRSRGFPKMTPSHIRNWLKRDLKAPAEVCRHLEELTLESGRGVVPRNEFRPDVFGTTIVESREFVSAEDHWKFLELAQSSPDAAAAFAKGLAAKCELALLAYVDRCRSSPAP